MPKMGDYRGKVLINYQENPFGMRQIGHNAVNIYMRNMAGEITKEMKLLLNGPFGGRIAPRHGEFPIGRVTEELRNSIQTSTVASPDPLAPYGWEISADVDYAGYVAYGTQYVPPRDFLSAAVTRIMNKNIGRSE